MDGGRFFVANYKFCDTMKSEVTALFSVFLFAFNAVMPLLLLLFLGYALKRANFFNNDFLSLGNKLVFKVLLPMTIFHNIYEVEGIGSFNWSLVLFSCVIILLLCGLGLLCSKLFIQPREAKGVFVQCSFRSNFAIIGLPLAESLGGASAAAMAAVLSAFTIPLFNVLAVILLTVYAGGEKGHSAKKIVTDILKNPLILAAAAGLVCLLVRSLLPVNEMGQAVFTIEYNLPWLFKCIRWLHQSSGPLALIIMGGLLNFNAISGKLKNIVFGTVFRVLFAPVVGLSLTYLCCELGWISCGAGEYGSLIALFGSPVAVSSAIMVTSIGGDDELARQYVVWTSVASMVSLFLITAVLRGLAII